MAISLRISNQETALIKQYAKLHNMSVSDLRRQAVMEKIEAEYDLAAYQKAMDEFAEDTTIYSLDEVERELELK